MRRPTRMVGGEDPSYLSATECDPIRLPDACDLSGAYRTTDKEAIDLNKSH